MGRKTKAQRGNRVNWKGTDSEHAFVKLSIFREIFTSEAFTCSKCGNIPKIKITVISRKGLQISGNIQCHCDNAIPVKIQNVEDDFNKAFCMGQLVSGQRSGRMDLGLQM